LSIFFLLSDLRDRLLDLLLDRDLRDILLDSDLRDLLLDLLLDRDLRDLLLDLLLDRDLRDLLLDLLLDRDLRNLLLDLLLDRDLRDLLLDRDLRDLLLDRDFLTLFFRIRDLGILLYKYIIKIELICIDVYTYKMYQRLPSIDFIYNILENKYASFIYLFVIFIINTLLMLNIIYKRSLLVREREECVDIVKEVSDNIQADINDSTTEIVCHIRKNIERLQNTVEIMRDSTHRDISMQISNVVDRISVDMKDQLENLELGVLYENGQDKEWLPKDEANMSSDDDSEDESEDVKIANVISRVSGSTKARFFEMACRSDKFEDIAGRNSILYRYIRKPAFGYILANKHHTKSGAESISVCEEPDEDVEQEEIKPNTCPFIVIKGPRSGQRCGAKQRVGGTHCFLHKNFER
jgi:hypothetical protein